jgi:ribosomal-protein-alanine N-acetyltransferase
MDAPPVTIRPMRREDIITAAAIEQSVYSQPWTVAIFEDEVGREGRTYLVAEFDEDVVGYGGVMLVGDEAHITTVVVRPERRGDRVGTRLILGLVESALGAGARSLTLEVRTSNAAAQALYRRFGMAPVGVRKQYYRDEDALIMWAHDVDGEEYAELLESIRSEVA